MSIQFVGKNSVSGKNYMENNFVPFLSEICRCDYCILSITLSHLLSTQVPVTARFTDRKVMCTRARAELRSILRFHLISVAVISITAQSIQTYLNSDKCKTVLPITHIGLVQS